MLFIYRMIALFKRCNRYVWMVSALLTLLQVALPTMAHAANVKVTTYYGELDEVHHTPHDGIDFGMPEGTPIQSLTDGKVIAVVDDGSKLLGRSVHVLDQRGEEVIYGHLSKPLVHVWQHIHFNDVLALSGNTGDSTGPHLHLELKINGAIVNPARLVIEANQRAKFQK